MVLGGVNAGNHDFLYRGIIERLRWFDEYVYQAAVEREYLGELAACCDAEPTVLEPWDPMGTLAR